MLHSSFGRLQELNKRQMGVVWSGSGHTVCWKCISRNFLHRNGSSFSPTMANIDFPLSRLATSSAVGIRWCPRWIPLFRSRGSKHSPNEPSCFLTMTELLTHGVGLSTLWTISIFSSCWIFSFSLGRGHCMLPYGVGEQQAWQFNQWQCGIRHPWPQAQ